MSEFDSLAAQDDIVDRLVDRLPYLAPAAGGTCAAVIELATAMAIEGTPAPAALVEYGDNDSDDPRVMGVGRQATKQIFDIFLVAACFRVRPEAPPGMIGLQQMESDVFRALCRYQLPSPRNDAGVPYIRLWHVRTRRFGLFPERVIYRSQWRCTGLRSGSED